LNGILCSSRNLESGNKDITLLGLLSESGELTVSNPSETQDEKNSGQMLWITHYLDLNGSIDLVGESQLLQKRYGYYNDSPANNNYITNQFSESILDDESSGFLERDQQGTGNLYHYNDWSSPVGKIAQPKGTAFTVGDVLFDGTVSSSPSPILWIGGHNGADGIPSISIADYWIYAYRNFNGDYSNWEQIGAGGALVEGEGYLMKGPGKPNDGNNIGQNYVFKGKPHNGNISLDVAAQYTYLVGNPYPSALDANQFIDDNIANIETATAIDGNNDGSNVNITGTLYFWEHWGTNTHILRDYQAGYAIYSKMGGTVASAIWDDDGGDKIPQRYIPVGQAFYVIGKEDGEPIKTIKFNNNQRDFEREASGKSIFLKSANSKAKQVMKAAADSRLKIRVAFKIDNTAYRQILFGVDKNTTNGYDIGYDGDIFQIFPDDMYMVMEDKKLVIQAFGELQQDHVIPIGILTNGEGIVKIYIEKIENPYEEMEVYIRNNATLRTYDILNDTFEVDLEKGEFNDKYSIVLKYKSEVEEVSEEVSEELEEETAGVDELIAFVTDNNATIRIKKPEELVINSISLFNVIGQQIKAWNSNLIYREMDLPIQVSAGVYMIMLETNQGTKMKKLVIK